MLLDGKLSMYQLWRISLDKIYIPTLGRHDNQITYNALPDKWKKLVIMVVQKKEEHLYEYDCEYLVVDNDIGIAKTREIIYRHGGRCRYIMIDDESNNKSKNYLNHEHVGIELLKENNVSQDIIDYYDNNLLKQKNIILDKTDY